MSFQAIAQQCQETMHGRGEALVTWERIPDQLCAIRDAIDKLVVAIETGSTREQSLASAAVAVPVLVAMADLKAQCWTVRGRMHGGPRRACSAPEMVRRLHEYVGHAWRAHRADKRGDVLISLELVLAQLVDLRTRVLNLPNVLQGDVSLWLALGRRLV